MLLLVELELLQELLLLLLVELLHGPVIGRYERILGCLVFGLVGLCQPKFFEEGRLFADFRVLQQNVVVIKYFHLVLQFLIALRTVGRLLSANVLVFAVRPWLVLLKVELVDLFPVPERRRELTLSSLHL